MKSYAFVILALVSVMFSCSDDETTVADQARSESTGHFVSLAEALENAGQSEKPVAILAPVFSTMHTIWIV